MHIRRDDTVEVMAGDDKGARGRVLRVEPRKDRAIIEGINRVYRHLRRSRKNPQGGRLEIEAPVHLSNLLPVCPKCSKATRVGFRTDESGKKFRTCRRCGAQFGEV
ncbi:MAG: 50S ribosomal protein L24 [Phycisphaerae bacterium]|nr:50S ribosomal protein L24 [Phycisphaerae bacterium]